MTKSKQKTNHMISYTDDRMLQASEISGCKLKHPPNKGKLA